MSKIEWTKQSWNPVTGCTKVSPGCKYCYAEIMTDRLQAMGSPKYQNGFKVTLHESVLNEPLTRKKPTTYFVNSMSDLFHEDIPDSFIDKVLDVAKRTKHTYQILTKRAERLPVFFKDRIVPDNVWIGVSVEDRKYGLPRIDYLRQVNGNRFLSIEPLLEDLGEFDLSGIHWVIVGGESGNNSRPCKEEWVLSIRDQCLSNNIPFFFKQWGGKDKKKSGKTLDGKIWQQTPVNQASMF